jgi:hypothetical protein
MTCFTDDASVTALAGLTVWSLAYVTALRWGGSLQWYALVYSATVALLLSAVLSINMPDVFGDSIATVTFAGLNVSLFVAVWAAMKAQQTYAIIAVTYFILVPILNHHSQNLSLWLQEHVSSRCPAWGGTVVACLLLLLVTAVILRSGMVPRLIGTAAVLVASLIVTVFVRMVLIEKTLPAPQSDVDPTLSKLSVCCFTQATDPPDRCPLDPGATMEGVLVFAVLLLFALVVRTISCCRWMEERRTATRTVPPYQKLHSHSRSRHALHSTTA